MLQVVIARDALQFLLNNLLHLLLDAPVICLHRFLHAVVAVCVSEIGNNGDFLVGTFLPFYLIGIHHNLAVENLLLDALVEVVGHRTDKHTLRKTGNGFAANAFFLTLCDYAYPIATENIYNTNESLIGDCYGRYQVMATDKFKGANFATYNAPENWLNWQFADDNVMVLTYGAWNNSSPGARDR